MKLRIGLLVTELDGLSNWQLRIIQDLLYRPEIQLTLIFASKLSSLHLPKTNKAKVFGKTTSAYTVTNRLLRRQLWFEERFFFHRPHNTELKDIISQLSSNERLTLDFASQNGVNIVHEEHIRKIKEMNLDIILNLSGLEGLEELSKGATHGIWEFMFADLALDTYGPTGFWEVLNKHEGIGFSLLNIRDDCNKKHLIGTGFFNRGWSITETKYNVQEGSVSVFSKAINTMLDGSFLPKDNVSSIKLATQKPSLLAVLRYCFHFYLAVLLKIWEKFANTMFAWRPERWSLFLGKGEFMKANLKESKPFDMPRDEFWADPFLFKHGNATHLFFENYSYRTKRGKISCGLLEGTKLVDIVDVLDMDYHLSFPFIFEEDGQIFLIPESSENERLEVYRAVEFPTSWELYATAFEGERVADAFFYTDDNSQKWLFLNKQVASTSPMNSELYIYKVDSMKLKRVEPHENNPVIIDARVARNGGAIFSYDGLLYRPSQRNTDAIYGRALNINKIEKLSLKEYSEKTERIVRPNFDAKLMAMHHLHELDGQFIFDAAYRRK